MYTPMSDIELVSMVLGCHTIDGAWHKLIVLQHERSEFVEELLAYNKREQSEAYTAKYILSDKQDTKAHHLLAEYHLADLATRIKFNRIRIEHANRELACIAKLLSVLSTHRSYAHLSDSDAAQAALYDEHVLEVIWQCYVIYCKTNSIHDVTPQLNALPFDTSHIISDLQQLPVTILVASHLFESLHINKQRVSLMRKSIFDGGIGITGVQGKSLLSFAVDSNTPEPSDTY